jgi:hypothetical protein
MPVDGATEPVSPSRLLAPWIGLVGGAGLLLGIAVLTLRRRTGV